MGNTQAWVEQEPAVGYTVAFPSGKREVRGEGAPAFTLSVADEAQLRRILEGNAYATALEFVRGQFDISGDLVAALRLRQQNHRRGAADRMWTLAARLAPARLETWFQGKRRAAENIRFHYDVSNAFYQTFLDSRMVYSEAYFQDPGWTLDEAQQAKLEKICCDLDLRPGERFLDVGCGWGALVIDAAQRRQAHAVGCTLSRNQHEFADSAIRARGLGERAEVRLMDYRDITGRFDKIASIGMFEHVGRHRLGQYFRKIHSLLETGGRFLNSGITRPQAVGDDPETWFLLRRVFPGGELAHLSDVVREAERAGFGVLEIASLRQHYARTCREWVERLRRNRETCASLVGEETYRTWLLYLAASAFSFETGQTEVFSLLMSKG